MLSPASKALANPIPASLPAACAACARVLNCCETMVSTDLAVAPNRWRVLPVSVTALFRFISVVCAFFELVAIAFVADSPFLRETVSPRIPDAVAVAIAQSKAAEADADCAPWPNACAPVAASAAPLPTERIPSAACCDTPPNADRPAAAALTPCAIADADCAMDCMDKLSAAVLAASMITAPKSVDNPEAAVDKPSPSAEILAKPVATLVIAATTSPTGRLAMISIPSATLRNPTPASFAAVPIDSITSATASRTLVSPPLMESTTVAMASPIPCAAVAIASPALVIVSLRLSNTSETVSPSCCTSSLTLSIIGAI